MKKLIIIPILLLFINSYTSYAAGINFITNKSWSEILGKAKKENKLIFLDAYTTWCGPCKYLQTNVFTDQNVGSFYNRNFINVKMDMEEGEGVQLSEDFEVGSYPTLLFINGDGEVVHKKIGAMDAEDFLLLGSRAIDPEQQFYTLKNKAMTGDLTPLQFHNWIHDAAEMEESDIDYTITSFLESSTHEKMEYDMLLILLDHTMVLTKEQLDFLFTRKKECSEITLRSSEEFDASFLECVKRFANHESIDYLEDSFDAITYENTIREYFPLIAALETQKMEIHFYYTLEKYTEFFDKLTSCITNTSLKLSAADLSSLMIKYSSTINEESRTDEFVELVSEFKPLPDESKTTYHKDLALLALYLPKDDSAKIKIYANKVLANEEAPEELKTQITKILEGLE